MKAYQFDVPATNKMPAFSGSCVPVAGETYRQAALREYNAARTNAGLPATGKMPAGTRYGRKGAV